MPNKPKWGPKDCAIRLLYKITSQKLISFVFAAGAILVLVILSRTAKALDSEAVVAAIRAIKDIAIALLAVRGVQGITGAFSDKYKEARYADPKRPVDDQVVPVRDDRGGAPDNGIPIR